MDNCIIKKKTWLTISVDGSDTILDCVVYEMANLTKGNDQHMLGYNGVHILIHIHFFIHYHLLAHSKQKKTT